ncbi:TraR/DksA family transcriptional regulator [Sulfurimonas sp.]|uniref:TraR/DksA family transcriptional regulator n=1 Tax=Sulfurimonas sp. TaxID=2022749 RepID=UPI003565C46E
MTKLQKEHNKDKIIQNLTAIQKVDRDDYGICAECEEKIIFGRLMLLPESTHCVSCISELNL